MKILKMHIRVSRRYRSFTCKVYNNGKKQQDRTPHKWYLYIISLYWNLHYLYQNSLSYQLIINFLSYFRQFLTVCYTQSNTFTLNIEKTQYDHFNWDFTNVMIILFFFNIQSKCLLLCVTYGQKLSEKW